MSRVEPRSPGWLIEQYRAAQRGESVPAAPASPAPAAYPAHRYFLWIAVVGAISGVLAVAGYAAGMVEVGVILAALPVAALIVYRPEFGLLILVLYVPYEYFGIIGGDVATLTRVLGILTFVTFLVHLPRTARIELRSAGLWLVILFAAWSMLTLIGAADPAFGWVYVLTRIQMAGLVFLVLNLCMTREQARAFLLTLFVAAVLAGVGAFILPQAEEAVESGRRSLGDQGINAHAKDLLPGLLLLPWVLARTRRRWLKVLAVLGSSIALLDLLSTGSRSNWVAAVVGIVAGIVVYRGATAGRRFRILVVLFIALAAVVGLGLLAGVASERVGVRVEEALVRGLDAGGRLELWGHALDLGLENPFMGIGTGQYIYAMMMRMAVGTRERAVHNDFLTHLAETGFTGLFLYVGFLAAVYWRVWRTADLKLRSCLFALVTAAVVASMANPSYMLKSFWLAMAAGLLAGLRFGDTPADETPVQSRAPAGA